MKAAFLLFRQGRFAAALTALLTCPLAIALDVYLFLGSVVAAIAAFLIMLFISTPEEWFKEGTSKSTGQETYEAWFKEDTPKSTGQQTYQIIKCPYCGQKNRVITNLKTSSRCGRCNRSLTY